MKVTLNLVKTVHVTNNIKKEKTCDYFLDFLTKPLYPWRQVLFLQKLTQILNRTNIVICNSYNSFFSILIYRVIIIFFYWICCWSPIFTCNKTFSEKCIVKNVLYILVVPKKFIKYFSNYSTERLKFKASGNFWTYNIFGAKSANWHLRN